MSDNSSKGGTNWVMLLGVLALIAGTGYAIASGGTVTKMGIPGIFEIEFGQAATPTPEEPGPAPQLIEAPAAPTEPVGGGLVPTASADEQRPDAAIPVISRGLPQPPQPSTAEAAGIPMDVNGDGIADAQYWDSDLNFDGRVDYRAWDTNLNGWVDQHVYYDPSQPGGAIYGFDPRETGVVESWGWDTDADGRTDTWAWDNNGNQVFDAWGWDQNRDGIIDLYGYDINEDGLVDEYQER